VWHSSKHHEYALGACQDRYKAILLDPSPAVGRLPRLGVSAKGGLTGER
jgi:hypothetical protein